MKKVWTLEDIEESIKHAWEWWYGMRDECPYCYYQNLAPEIGSKSTIWPNN